VKFNPDTGEFEGLPPEMQAALDAAGGSNKCYGTFTISAYKSEVLFL
jgi:hypothetical protein